MPAYLESLGFNRTTIDQMLIIGMTERMQSFKENR